MSLRLVVAGLWGHEVYAQRLIDHPATHLVAVASYPGATAGMEERLRHLAERHGLPLAAEPAGPLLDQPDLALIMVPPRLNPGLCAAALEQGVATLSEKPVAGNAAGARQLAQAVRAGGASYTACLPLAAFSGPFVAAREAAERIGPIRAAHFTYLAGRGPLYLADEPHYRDPDLPPTALSGGEAAMFSGYGVVAIEACCRARIRSVSATLASGFYPDYLSRGMEDLAHLVVTLDNGARGTVTVGRTPYPGDPRIELELHGEGGSIYWSRERDGAPAPDGIDALVDDFVESARARHHPRIASADVLSTVAVLGAAYRSAALGQPIDVPDLLADPPETWAGDPGQISRR